MAIPELNEVTSIEIFAEWFGLGTPRRSDYEIVARDGAFFGGNASIDPIDPRDIEALLLSLNAPPVHSPDPANMGFSPEWLELNLEQAIEDNLGGYGRQGKRRILERLRNFDDFSELVKRLYAWQWTDDSPFVRVRIYSHTCDPVEVRSSSQHTFMIPLGSDDSRRGRDDPQRSNRPCGSRSRVEHLGNDLQRHARFLRRSFGERSALGIGAAAMPLDLFRLPLVGRYVNRAAIASLASPRDNTLLE